MLLFNAVVLSVIVMLVLSVARVHVVISLFVASLVGGLVAGMGISGTMVAFQDGLAGGAPRASVNALDTTSRARAMGHKGRATGRVDDMDSDSRRPAWALLAHTRDPLVRFPHGSGSIPPVFVQL